MNLGNLDFDIVSDFDIRISYLKLPDATLVYEIRSTKDYVRKNNLFMQNKANFRKVKLNVNNVLTKDYDRMDTWSIRKTKPIQSQLKPIKANIMPKQSQFKPKQSQFPKRQKPMQTYLPQRIMKKTALSAPGKTNPNKTKSNPISKHLQSPICPGNLIINPMNQICCVFGLTVSFDSAKMALSTDNWNLKKDGNKKLKLLRCKRLNNPGRMSALTGTLFAYSYLRNIVLTN